MKMNIADLEVGTFISFRYIEYSKINNKNPNDLYQCTCPKKGEVSIVITNDKYLKTVYCKTICCNSEYSFGYRNRDTYYELFIRTDISYVII